TSTHFPYTTLFRSLAKLRAINGLSEKLAQVYQSTDERGTDDPDLMLYSGGFFSAQDKQWMEFIRQQSPDVLGELEIQREDSRLGEMLFRYRARNYPETLSGEEAERWEQYRYYRLTDPKIGRA